MAVHQLTDVQKRADKLTAAEQILLAKYLLAKVDRFKVGEEAILSESSLAKDWLRPEEDRGWASL